ncbi:unnamed protein product [Prorocentrum cordatum]|uniref:Uncharacterized protein n=1 Tax=Prorocentrum cordatum TaxID=2364126 RepID=A0ABN9WXZ3_9DINO|nr:unnamed protein product [Polarella glacialis]
MPHRVFQKTDGISSAAEASMWHRPPLICTQRGAAAGAGVDGAAGATESATARSSEGGDHVSNFSLTWSILVWRFATTASRRSSGADRRSAASSPKAFSESASST